MLGIRKKYYKELPCQRCAGSGKVERSGALSNIPGMRGDTLYVQSILEVILKYNQGICLSCDGRGTHTVLDRVE